MDMVTPPALPAFDVLAFSGPDARAFLQRMLSNDMDRLDVQTAVPAFLLDVTGRIISGGVFVEAGDGAIRAVTPAGWAEALASGLDKYRLADRVEWAADDRVSAVIPGAGDGTARPWTVVHTDGAIRVVWPMANADDVVAIGETSAEVVDPVAFHCRRIAAGHPLVGLDVRPGMIPLEAGLYDWLSNTKGCYVGQEVVERMWSRGRRARHLVRVEAAGGAPDALDEPRLEVTSALVCDDRWCGLGFWRGEPPTAGPSFEVAGVTVTIVPDEGQTEEAG